MLLCNLLTDGISLVADSAPLSRWVLAERDHGIVWHVGEDRRLPHGDGMEMSVRKERRSSTRKR